MDFTYSLINDCFFLVAFHFKNCVYTFFPSDTFYMLYYDNSISLDTSRLSICY